MPKIVDPIWHRTIEQNLGLKEGSFTKGRKHQRRENHEHLARVA